MAASLAIRLGIVIVIVGIAIGAFLSERPLSLSSLMRSSSTTIKNNAQSPTSAKSSSSPLTEVREQQQQQQPSPLTTAAVPRVPRIKMDPNDLDFAQRIADARTPVILTLTAVDLQWRARKLPWTPEYLRDHMMNNGHVLSGVYRNSRKTFIYYNEEEPLAQVLGNRWEKPFEVVESMPFDEFLTNIRTKKNPNNDNDNEHTYYHYFSGQIHNLGADLARDVEPSDFLTVAPPKTKSNNSNSNSSSNNNKNVNVWIGANGVTTQMHYDSFHNFYVQLHGRKRFLLMPPSAARGLYLYPRLHPSHRQSQIDFGDDDAAAATLEMSDSSRQQYPEFSNATAIEAILEEGDVLYLPPYWFHHVEALSSSGADADADAASISVNVWCDCQEVQAYRKILMSPIPFEESWSRDKLIQATKEFILMLVEAVTTKYNNSNSNKGGQDFIREHLVDTRYKALFESGKLSTAWNEQVSEDVCKYHQQHQQHQHHKTRPDDGTALRLHLRNQLQRGIDVLRPLFVEEMPDEDIRHILLANYIEELSYFLVGIENVGVFLKRCFFVY